MFRQRYEICGPSRDGPETSAAKVRCPRLVKAGLFGMKGISPQLVPVSPVPPSCPAIAPSATVEGLAKADLSRRSFNEGGMPTRERFPLLRAYGATSRPDKCLVVPSLALALRPSCARNTGANAVTTREGLRRRVIY
jgi:hypothetical protein